MKDDVNRTRTSLHEQLAYKHAGSRLKACGDISLDEIAGKWTHDQVVEFNATPTVPLRLAVLCSSLPRGALYSTDRTQGRTTN